MGTDSGIKPRLDELVEEAVGLLAQRGGEVAEKTKVVISAPWFQFRGKLENIAWLLHNNDEVKAAIVYAAAKEGHYPSQEDAVTREGEALYLVHLNRQLSPPAYAELQRIRRSISELGYKRIKLEDLAIWEANKAKESISKIPNVRSFYTVFGRGLYTHESHYFDVMNQIKQLAL